MTNSKRFPVTALSILVILCTFSVANAQHDPGRNAVREIATGDTAAAIRTVGKAPRKSNSAISEADRLFVLAMAAMKDADVDKAFSLVKESIAAGLPIERLQAGPRELFAPLHARGDYQDWLEPHAKVLLHGPMLGYVTQDSARFWVRTSNEVKLGIALSKTNELEGKDLKVVKQMEKVISRKENDFTGTVAVTGLSPHTQYTYQVLLDDQPVGPIATFRTHPEQDTPSKFQIGFGGGAGFTPMYEKNWATIASHNLSAFFLLGDNVYIDDPKHRMSQQYCYYRRQSQPQWRDFVAKTPIYSIYDDHDFGVNDCVPGPKIEIPVWKRPVWETFKQNWVNPGYGGGPSQPGCWYDFWIGEIHFIFLDCRYYRDLKGGSMIGPVQKKWLLETLASSTGTFKVIASSVPWSPGVKPGSRDTWDGFANEREEIFRHIEKNNISGVLLMSADRHRSDLRKIPRKDGYDFYEVMSSRLTNVHTHGLVSGAKGSKFIMGYNETPSFGRLEFDTTASTPSIEYKIFDIDNQEQGSAKILLSELE